MSVPGIRLTSSAPSRAAASSRSFAARRLSFLFSAKPGNSSPVVSSTNAAAKSLTTLQEANPRNLPEVWFSSTFPTFGGPPAAGLNGREPHDERKARLGKTLRVLQERLPTLLESPLPQEILAPNISLHLFPSTHPHLPTVSGRVAYNAALWTSPIAWNRVPVIGNVKLEILSERMVDQPVHFSPRRAGARGEQLIVRWRTVGKAKGHNGREFTGLFIFEFDGEGKILSHTIEHVEEGGQWEQGVGAKVVGLTDWLLGGIKGGTPVPTPFHVPTARRYR